MNKSKILITGSEGFIGSNLLEYLCSNTDFIVCSLSRTITENKLFQDRIISISHDLTNPLDDKLFDVLTDVEYVIHLAGSSDIKRSQKKPTETFYNNVVATFNLLEYSRRYMPKIKKIIFFSTAEVFGPSKDRKFKEEDVKNPQSVYAFTKTAAENICDMYCKVYGLPVITTYTMNVYGKNQPRSKFLPKIIDEIANNQNVSLHATTKPNRRNYLHVDDISSAIHFIILNGYPGERYNIISDTETDNLKIAKIIADVLETELKFEFVSSPDHHAKSILCGSKINTMGWKPKIPFKRGLKEYINEK